MRPPPEARQYRFVGVVSGADVARAGGENTFLWPTKNPRPKVSVVKVIVDPLGTASH